MAIPEQFGPYTIVGFVGRGGMSEVHRARTPDGRLVALKVLSGEAAQKVPQFLARFKREISSLMALSHPHIVVPYDAGQIGGWSYIAMELLEGESLKARLVTGPLPHEALARLIRETASAVAYCHDRGILHRDLKPTNLFLMENGAVKLLDFGLSKGDRDAPVTSAGRRIGTPRYFAPEVVRGQPCDRRSDIFQLGLIYYEAACGEPAFPGSDLMSVLGKVLNADPVPLSSRRPDLAPGFAALIDNCIRKDPDRRYQRAREVEADLAIVEAGGTPTAR